MGLVIDTPWCFGPWTRVDSAGQPIELSATLDDLDRDAAERAEAREMVKKAKVWAGGIELAEPRGTHVVELAGPGAAADGAGVAAGWEAKAQQAERAVARRLAKQLAQDHPI